MARHGADPNGRAERKDRHVDGTRLAADLGFPEGPVVMPDGAIVFCDGNTGELLQWHENALGTYAVTGGSPWGAILGTDGGDLRHAGRQRPWQRRSQRRSWRAARARRWHGRAARLEHRRARAGRPQRSRLRPRRAAVVHRLRHRGRRPLSGARAGPSLRPRCLRRRRARARAPGGLSERHRVRRPGAPVLDGVARPPRLPARGRRRDDVRPAQRRPRARRHGIRRRRPGVRVHHHLARHHRALARGRDPRGDQRSASTRRTACSTAPPCT